MRTLVLAWVNDVQKTYLGDLSYYGYALATSACCLPGYTPEERAAWIEEATLFYLDPAKKLLNGHLRYMTSHPAPSCIRDGYQADNAAANAYLAWLSGWYPHGYSTPGGRAQYLAWQDVEAGVDDFIAMLQTYLADCS